MFWPLYIGVAVGLFCIWPTPASSYIASSTGCHHNGTWYADKSLVPTVEKCLNCQCSKKTLVCRLKVCPEMPMPPPRGCVVVQPKNTCCPYLSCARLDAFYNIPTTRRIIAYLDHYERESIDRVVNENVLQRRSDDSEPDLYVCVKNGTVYKSGSAMSSSNLCTYCYCIGGTEKCVKPKCMLPVEGCKPIFVDSTCCPVRYDCSTKTSGKSSQEVRYRKTSNKHFLRNSQRLQRNRGCTLKGQFYAEGQKMKSDLDKPCDICFCIRGSRRCAPKKCSPPLKNCMPVVPKGQCCPSSYDCGSQRDYRRAQSSRQFNLFSLLFGKEDGSENDNSTEVGAMYPLDRHPSAEFTTTTDRTLYDTLREGLEFIDGNNNHMLADNLDLIAMQNPQLVKETKLKELTKPPPSSEVSFLDLLLAPNEPATGEVAIEVPEEKTPSANDGLSWVDLLLGPEEEERRPFVTSTISDKLDDELDGTTPSSDFEALSIDRLGEGNDEPYGIGEVSVGSDDKANRASGLDESSEKGQEQSATEKVVHMRFVPTSTTTSTTPTPTTRKVDPSTTTTVRAPLPQKEEVDIKLPKLPIQGSQGAYSKETPVEDGEPSFLGSILGGLSDILSEESTLNVALKESQQNVSTTTTTTKPLTTSKPTNRPMPMFKPLPSNKLHTRINSKIANLTMIKPPNNNKGKIPSASTEQLPSTTSTTTTVKTPKTTLKPSTSTTTTTTRRQTTTTRGPSSTTTRKPTTTTRKPTTTTRKPTTTTRKPTATTRKITTTRKTTPTAPISTTKRLASKKKATTTHSSEASTITTTTVKPAVVINTNPTILEAEPLDTSVEHTLPPSLPNLQIIPFLPTDAVESDHPKPLYDYYSTNQQTSKMDYDPYDESNVYPIPSITEQYPTYPELEDPTKAEYIYKFNVEGPVASVAATIDKMDVPVAPSEFLKYDFTSGGGFSPPLKTEGGFMPKDPLIIDDTHDVVEGNDQVTKHIIDITTAEPMRDNTTKPIEITTPDPFKDVIHTEPPPDLSSLIEDKEKILHASHPSTEENPETGSGGLGAHTPPALASITVTGDSLSREVSSVLVANAALSAPSSAVPPFKTLPDTVIPPEVSSTMKTAESSAAPTEAEEEVKTKAASATEVPNPPKSPTKVTTNRKHQTSTSTAAIARGPNATATTTRKTKPKLPTTRRPTRRPSPPPSPATSSPTVAASTTTTTTKRPSTATSTEASEAISAATTKHPYFMSPFDKLPFMDASFDVKRQPVAATPPKTSTSSVDLLGLVHYKNSINKFEGLEPTYQQPQHEYPAPQSSLAASASTATTTTPSTTGSLALANVQQHALSNSLIDPAGILKLAGCNIYGRMYRVGRIILELSSACVECKCTEVGVKCGPLDC